MTESNVRASLKKVPRGKHLANLLKATEKTSSKQYLLVIRELLRDIGTPFAETILGQIERNEPITVDANPSNYTNASEFFSDVQALALIKKNPHYECGIPKAQNALEKFMGAEEQCARTNTFFRKSLQAPRTGDLWQILYSARRFVQAIIGDEPGYLKPDFGPGATTNLKGFETNIVSKLRTVPEVTPEFYSEAHRMILTTLPLYAISCGLVTRTRTTVEFNQRLPTTVGNVFTTVPKDWKTDRPICIEPGANMLFQKAYGNLIRRRLLRYGFDLDKRPDLHAEYARVGSIDDSLSTIDLASASDTISKEFVRFLLPQAWYDALDLVRCRRTVMPDGSVLKNEKFSSMGNGFTFELESLLFYSLLLAVRQLFGKKRDVVSCFGDDIIVSRHLAAKTIAILEFSGFTINLEKSFVSGPFKESCGHDYYRGVNVRPIYFKGIAGKKSIEQLFYILNRIRKMAARFYIDNFCDPRFRNTWKSVLNRVPVELRLYGPDSLGDTCILEATQKHVGYITLIPQKVLSDEADVLLAAACYGIDGSGVAPRGCKYNIKVVRRYWSFKTDSWVKWLDAT